MGTRQDAPEDKAWAYANKRKSCSCQEQRYGAFRRVRRRPPLESFSGFQPFTASGAARGIPPSEAQARLSTSRATARYIYPAREASRNKTTRLTSLRDSSNGGDTGGGDYPGRPQHSQRHDVFGASMKDPPPPPPKVSHPSTSLKPFQPDRALSRLLGGAFHQQPQSRVCRLPSIRTACRQRPFP